MIATLYPCFRHWSAKGIVCLISDTHFDDPDCKLMDPRWITPKEHIARLSFLTKNDTLIHLGDVGNPEYLKLLPCYKVLIMGNHDQSATKFEPYFDEIYKGPLMVGEKLILSHEPVNVPWAFNIHGHAHGQYNTVTSPFHDHHFNIASNVVFWEPMSLNYFIDHGYLKAVSSIHRLTIDAAAAEKLNKNQKGKHTMKYRKKPVEIEAVRWTGENFTEIENFVGDSLKRENYYCTGEVVISTLEGDMKASFGDYIIKGVDGEFYPCKPDIFAKTYTPVEAYEASERGAVDEDRT